MQVYISGFPVCASTQKWRQAEDRAAKIPDLICAHLYGLGSRSRKAEFQNMTLDSSSLSVSLDCGKDVAVFSDCQVSLHHRESRVHHVTPPSFLIEFTQLKTLKNRGLTPLKI